MGNLNLNPTPFSKICKKIGLRFACIFFILFIVFLDFYSNIFTDIFYDYAQLDKLSDKVIFWVGKDLFQIPYTIIRPVIGDHSDSTYIYLLYFSMLAVAALGAIIWSFLQRKENKDEKLYYWLTVIIRYYLAFTLFAFALEKFYKTQFPDLSFYKLSEPLGDMSPMGFAYAFFGFSHGYNIFMGVVESAALLLLFRRTTTLGALLSLVALTNVILINFNYDLHAKMYPMVMFAMTLFLLGPQLKRIFKFFLTHQTTSLRIIKAPIINKKWIKVTKIVIKVFVIGINTIPLIMWYQNSHMEKKDKKIANGSYYGIYDVQEFVVGKDTLSVENPLRWNQIIIDGKMETVRLKNDSVAFMNISFDQKEILVYADRTELEINKNEIKKEYGHDVDVDSILIEKHIKSLFHFELSDLATLKLKGKIRKDSVFITAQKRPIKTEDYRLNKRGFHWITEVPYVY